MFFTRLFCFNVAQRTLYDYRGADGTGTSTNKVAPDSANAKSYTVRKLADGNCWMTENLTLPLTAGTTVEASYNTSATAYSFAPTSCSTNGACAINGNTTYNGTTGQYYYSWYAATAGSGTSADVNVDAYGSICPKGWRLPSYIEGRNGKSFTAITYAYLGIQTSSTTGHVSTLMSFPLSFTLSGEYISGSFSQTDGAHGVTQSGYYLYSTASSSTNVYRFRWDSGYTNPDGSQNKSYGQSVRCVAQ